MTTKIRTRFAPSPTGFIHLGNIRSALYPWAFARANNGTFILRIEDTDQDRSSQAAVDVILESIRFMGMDYDEGPIYQMQRLARYKDVLLQMLEQNLIYPCYMSIEALDQLREKQMSNKEKPRYDGTWRPEIGKILPPIPDGVKPCWRFKNPASGSIAWEDKVKGRVEFSNTELDDLVIARPAEGNDCIGAPTYNFCVVVDDIDMEITHVIRGDDHVNNTPRQINIFMALKAQPPIFAHLPTVLNESGEKLSKRSGAKPVTEYEKEGYLPEAMLNYLARLGWSHGDDEVFTRQQFLEWFTLDSLGRSAAQFDEAKLRWVNSEHMKRMTGEALAPYVIKFLREQNVPHESNLASLCDLLKDRCETTIQLAQWVALFYTEPVIDDALLSGYLNVPNTIEAIDVLREKLMICPWDKASISMAIKSALAMNGLKMPQLAMPIRVLVMGTPHTPSLDAVLELCGRERVLQRLRPVHRIQTTIDSQVI
jgi:glutamyl-tRNA synthetase